jgi:hypothetical protein
VDIYFFHWTDNPGIFYLANTFGIFRWTDIFDIFRRLLPSTRRKNILVYSDLEKKPVALQKPEMPEPEIIVKFLPFKSPFIKKFPTDKILSELTCNRSLTQIKSQYILNSEMYKSCKKIP